jgi:signal transduction histidine kinase
MADQDKQLHLEAVRNGDVNLPQNNDSRTYRSLPTLASRTGYLSAVLSIALTTLIFGLLRHWLIPEQAFLLYLPTVIMVAVRYDFGASVVASVLSFFCWDFFFVPPYHNLTINDPRNWLSLLMFLIASLFTANVALRARQQTVSAEARAKETEILYQASEAINREVDPERLLQTLVDKIVQVCAPSRCIVFEWRESSKELVVEASAPQAMDRAVLEDVQKIAESVLKATQPIGFRDSPQYWADELRSLGISADSIADSARGIYIALHVHGRDMGVLHAGLNSNGAPFTPQKQRFMLTLANHAAVVMARQVTAEEAQIQVRNNAVAEERNRLARDVHDTLSHTFSGIKFLLEAAVRIDSVERGRKCIDEARRLAREGAQEARRSVWALRPAALESAGDLASAIWTMGKSVSGESLVADIVISGDPYALPAEIEENLFRIAQEALTNVVRHSGATRVEIELGFEDGRVSLRVEDNGCGRSDSEESDGFGTTSMRQRAARIDACFDMSSKPGEGTRVELTAPIPQSRDIQYHRWNSN